MQKLTWTFELRCVAGQRLCARRSTVGAARDTKHATPCHAGTLGGETWTKHFGLQVSIVYNPVAAAYSCAATVHISCLVRRLRAGIGRSIASHGRVSPAMRSSRVHPSISRFKPHDESRTATVRPTQANSQNDNMHLFMLDKHGALNQNRCSKPPGPNRPSLHTQHELNRV